MNKNKFQRSDEIFVFRQHLFMTSEKEKNTLTIFTFYVEIRYAIPDVKMFFSYLKWQSWRRGGEKVAF